MWALAFFLITNSPSQPAELTEAKSVSLKSSDLEQSSLQVESFFEIARRIKEIENFDLNVTTTEQDSARSQRIGQK